MPKVSVVPTGTTESGVCEARVPGICLYPNKAGALLIYRNADSVENYRVCRACADKMFISGQWELSGEHETRDMHALRSYLRDISLGGPNIEKIHERYKDFRWKIRVPLSSGKRIRNYWLVRTLVPSFGSTLVAFPMRGVPERYVLGGFGDPDRLFTFEQPSLAKKLWKRETQNFFA